MILKYKISEDEFINKLKLIYKNSNIRFKDSKLQKATDSPIPFMPFWFNEYGIYHVDNYGYIDLDYLSIVEIKIMESIFKDYKNER